MALVLTAHHLFHRYFFKRVFSEFRVYKELIRVVQVVLESESIIDDEVGVRSIPVRDESLRVLF